MSICALQRQLTIWHPKRPFNSAWASPALIDWQDEVISYFWKHASTKVGYTWSVIFSRFTESLIVNLKCLCIFIYTRCFICRQMSNFSSLNTDNWLLKRIVDTIKHCLHLLVYCAYIWLYCCCTMSLTMFKLHAIDILIDARKSR